MICWPLCGHQYSADADSRISRQLEASLGRKTELNLQQVAKSSVYSLSGGERRRVEIARALACSPKFMLLDEPFAGIDPIVVGDLQNIVRSMKAKGIGILITDHNVRETLGICDRSYILSDGAVIEEGTPEEIAASSVARQYYLGESFSL